MHIHFERRGSLTTVEESFKKIWREVVGWINLTQEKVHPSCQRRFARSAEGLSTVRLPSMELHDSYHQHKEEDCRPGGCTW